MIVVVGLSHKSAPIEVRERIALGRDSVPGFLKALVAEGPVAEALLVSTCNRVELVAAGRHDGCDLREVGTSCLQALERHAPGISAHVYEKLGGEAVRHLFRVASSLDSLVLGEPQILGQVKEALDVARGAGTLGNVLNRTVPRVIRTAKRVRSETEVGAGQVSVPSVAVDLTRQIFGELRDRTVLLVGSGEMAQTVARLLKTAGATLMVIGRTRARVEELAASVGGEPRAFSDLKASLAEADIVVTSTSAPSFIIDYEMVQGTRRSRRGGNQTFIDLAVPRDVDPRVNGIDGVFSYNVDDLSGVVADTLSARSREAELAEHIVEEETRGFERWADAEQATPTIVKLRAHVRRALRAELERSLRGRLRHLGMDERDALEKLLESAENRVLHTASVRLRRAAAEPGQSALAFDELALALSELFALDGNTNDIEDADEVTELSEPNESNPVATGTSGRWPSTR